MSDNQNQNLDTPNQDVDVSDVNADKGSVSYDSYEKVLKQRKADQAKARELEEKLAILAAERAAEEEAKLKEQNKWQELANQKEQQLAELQAERAKEQQAIIEYEKQRAFREEVGELANPAYATLIDLNQIPLDEEGKVDKEALRAYGKDFKEKHSGLFKKSAPDTFTSSNAPRATPSVSDVSKYQGMSEREINQLRLKEAREKFRASRLGQ